LKPENSKNFPPAAGLRNTAPSATTLQPQPRSKRYTWTTIQYNNAINTIIHSPFTLMIIHSSVGSFRIIRTFDLEWMEFLCEEMSKIFFSLRSKTATAPRISLITALNNMIGENEREIKRKKLILYRDRRERESRTAKQKNKIKQDG
jgi:hypothetical protein